MDAGMVQNQDAGEVMGDLELTIEEFSLLDVFENIRATPTNQLVVVTVTLRNTTAQDVSAGPEAYTLETDQAARISASGAAAAPSCPMEGLVGAGASRTCTLVFQVPTAQRPRWLDFAWNALTARASFIGLRPEPVRCATMGPENTRAACGDGCTNDGDDFVDCDDMECCGVRPDCPFGTYCGGAPISCQAGPEREVRSCLDNCDNDSNGSADCEDPACCDLIACPSATRCGGQADPFAGQLALSDQAVASLNPSQLRAGETPCRAPELVRVMFVNDGDTFRVTQDNGSFAGSVRLLGVDTPEIGQMGAPDDCYASEAEDFTRQLVGRLVYLTFDNECMDGFGRHLAYVHFGPASSDMLQRHLLRRGFARTFITNENNDLELLLRHDFMLAQADGAGLHTACP